MRTRFFARAAALALAGCTAILFGQAPGAGGSGQDLFQAYCASCHGMDGRGAGPAGAVLKVPAANLTLLSKNAGGEFPSQRVMMALGANPGGRGAHGNPEMPVWGDVFRQAGQDADVVQARIYTLTRYIESIQQPAPKPAARKVALTKIAATSGREMFRAYCASCHGMDARGNGPAAANLRKSPPDLTVLAKNNGGKFPELAVVNTLGWMRGTAAHGSKEMPVWGELMREGRENEQQVKLRLHNLTQYVASLQAK